MEELAKRIGISLYYPDGPDDDDFDLAEPYEPAVLPGEAEGCELDEVLDGVFAELGLEGETPHWEGSTVCGDEETRYDAEEHGGEVARTVREEGALMD